MRAESFFRALALVCALLICSGCFRARKEDVTRFNSLVPVDEKSCPELMDSLALEGLETALDQSLTYFKRVPLDRKFRYGTDLYTAAHMIVSLEHLKTFLGSGPDPRSLERFIRRDFRIYEARGNDEGKVLFTGYYEPTYPGSRSQSPACPYPVYSKPDDLLLINLSDFSDQYQGHRRLKARVDTARKKVLPYYSREQISRIEDFHQRAVPVAFLKSRIDRFFLEIQGSGRVLTESGEQVRVHYAESNGNAYRSVGRYLIDKGEIEKEKMSMQAIRRWLEAHPERMDEVLFHNQSFVFFKEEPDGPLGSLGVKVSAFRTLATDARLFPKGALCFAITRLPATGQTPPLEQWGRSGLWVMNQDTGGAIRGPARADLFCGNGSHAEFTAGHKNVYGRLFFLVLDPDRS